MERRYGALGFIAGLYQIAGIIIAVGAILLGAVSLIGARGFTGSQLVTSALTLLFSGLLTGIGLYAFGQLLNLFRDMELNSRRSAAALEQLVNNRQSGTPSSRH